MSHRAFRYDVVKMTGPRKDSRGYLIADAVLARTGIQEYQMPDGKVRRELRPDDEVLHPDSLDTIRGTVAVNNHPPMALDATNTKQFAVGFLKGEPKKGTLDGGHKTIMDQITVYDAKAIEDIEKGKNQISQGYFCDVEMSPGVHPVYGAYDAIQRNIKHNHSAIVDEGRAGPKVGIKMDSPNKGAEFGFMIYKKDESLAEESKEKDHEDQENEAIAKLQEIQAKEKAEEEKETKDEDGDGGDDEDFDEDEEGLEIDQKWTSSVKASLPKDSFAHMGKDGKGRFPFKNAKGDVDLPHLKNALAKIGESNIPSVAKLKAKTKLEAIAKNNGVNMQKKDFANSDPKLNSNNKEGESFMPLIFKLDGEEGPGYQFEEKHDAFLTKVGARLAELKTLKADNAQLAKNIDEQKSEIEKLKVIVNDEKAMEQRVEERVQIKSVAKEMFPEETKLDSFSTLEIQKKIVKKINPEMDVEKKDAAFIQGMALGIISSFKTDGTKKLEEGFKVLARDGGGQPTFNADKAFSQLGKAVQNAWKPDYLEKHDKGYVSPA